MCRMNQHLCHHNEVFLTHFFILPSSVFTDVSFTQVLFENLKFYSLHDWAFVSCVCKQIGIINSFFPRVPTAWHGAISLSHTLVTGNVLSVDKNYWRARVQSPSPKEVPGLRLSLKSQVFGQILNTLEIFIRDWTIYSLPPSNSWYWLRGSLHYIDSRSPNAFKVQVWVPGPKSKPFKLNPKKGKV